MKITRERARRGRNEAVAELLFIALPILLTVFVLSLRARLSEVASSPEWAFAAAIMAGQCVVRLAVASSNAARTDAAALQLVAALLLVLYGGSVAILLTILLLDGDCPVWVSFLQLGVFVICACAFVVFSALARATHHDSGSE